mmetsp:Transcript_7603/g.20342  ORF Transcript_7603/g.20342 Transcript_7603/m.20342 type:complete len:221 (+) Transcript_7603:778-1440(+)
MTMQSSFPLRPNQCAVGRMVWRHRRIGLETIIKRPPSSRSKSCRNLLPNASACKYPRSERSGSSEAAVVAERALLALRACRTISSRTGESSLCGVQLGAAGLGGSADPSGGFGSSALRRSTSGAAGAETLIAGSVDERGRAPLPSTSDVVEPSSMAFCRALSLAEPALGKWSTGSSAGACCAERGRVREGELDSGLFSGTSMTSHRVRVWYSGSSSPCQR